MVAARRSPLWLGGALAAAAPFASGGASGGASAGPPVETRVCADPEPAHEEVRGITISCQTWGWEWGQDAFGDELDELAALGANWVAIHPYAGVRGDGRIVPSGGELDAGAPPPWLARPPELAAERGMALFVKPHLAYWGSPFRWRGEIRFDEAEARERFWSQYSRWIVELARATRGVAGFCVGTELDGMLADEARWRELIARVREATDARLTYAANWDRFEEVPFWDALDAVGIQAYFPLSEEPEPDERDLHAGWERVLPRLRALHERTGKPVVFTELGYDVSMVVASRPWSDGAPAEPPAARVLRERCMRVALAVLAREARWLRGAFLWKWFVGEPGRNDATFLLDTPGVREVISDSWRGPS